LASLDSLITHELIAWIVVAYMSAPRSGAGPRTRERSSEGGARPLLRTSPGLGAAGGGALPWLSFMNWSKRNLTPDFMRSTPLYLEYIWAARARGTHES
jgi:hypothetical protein